ncbi:hypothetical protein PAPYR_11869 [Paratrimastix pyriformis]|uniref:Uncharacterized protein n=1 Tax=Paratrimastix pyriformis TaxID=342808 RepID=A0ABQ8U7N1_9EUKA|nr:hypothetical protein PAPYR_11869 [Paratrimastix pyriformis]
MSSLTECDPILIATRSALRPCPQPSSVPLSTASEVESNLPLSPQKRPLALPLPHSSDQLAKCWQAFALMQEKTNSPCSTYATALMRAGERDQKAQLEKVTRERDDLQKRLQADLETERAAHREDIKGLKRPVQKLLLDGEQQAEQAKEAALQAAAREADKRTEQLNKEHQAAIAQLTAQLTDLTRIHHPPHSISGTGKGSSGS